MSPLEVSNALNVCFDREQHKKLFADFIGQYGFDHFTITVLDSSQPLEVQNKNFSMITTYSDEWVSHYIRNSFICYDAVAEVVGRGPTMLAWDDCVPQSTYKSEAKRILEEAKEFGLCYGGLGMSYTTPKGLCFGVGMAGSEKGVLTRNDAGAEAAFNAIYFLTEKFYTQHKERFLRLNVRQAYLTDRQLECLSLLSDPFKYKKEEDIASAMGITVNGVKKLNRQIYTKLGVENRFQAAMKASELELL